MNLLHHPELLEHIASSYALGTLRGGARRRFEAMAREQAPVRAAALIWQSRLASLNELQVAVAPPANVWLRIQNLLDAERALARATAQPGAGTQWLRSLRLWRGLSLAGAVATVAAVGLGFTVRAQLGSELAQLQAQLRATPQIAYVAVLADAQANASMLVTFDPKDQKLTLQRVGNFQEASDRSLQLWALPTGGAPRSLGVLGRDKLLRLIAGETDVRAVSALAISLEPQGGVPSAGGPTGPVLFKGALIQKML